VCPAQNLTTKVNLDALHLCCSSRIATPSLVFCWFSPLILSHTKVYVIYIYTHIYKVKIVLHVSHYAAILRSGDRRGASNGSAQNFKNIDDGPIKVATSWQNLSAPSHSIIESTIGALKYQICIFEYPRLIKDL
jgi:hypothetical protein